MNSIFAYMKKYAAMLAAQDYPLGPAARLITETEEGVFGTVKGADLSALTEADVEKLPLKTLPKGRQDIRSIVISQTPACQEWLRRGEALFPSLDDMAQIIGTRAAVIDARRGLQKAVPQLTRIMRTNAGCFLIIGQAEDGSYLGYTMTVGRTPYEAIVAMTVLEKSAEVTLLAERIGGPRHIAPWECKLMRTIYMKKYSRSEAKAKAAEAAAAEAQKEGRNPEASEAADANAQTPANPAADLTDGSSGTCCCEDSAPQSPEAILRRQLVDYGRRLVASGLVQGTWGNLSVRLDDTYMLTTPSGLDYMRLTPADMVKVNLHTLEYEGALKPTSEKGLHAAIYQNRPDAGAIIHTHAKYCSVYAAARRDLPVPASAESLQTPSLQNEKSIPFSDPVKLAAYALPGTKALMKNTAAAVGSNSGAIMAGHGMIVCGKDLETAFQNGQQLEAIAEASLQK